MTHTESVRVAELEAVLVELRADDFSGKLLLEIGAGGGWQARKLAENGYKVEALDLIESAYWKEKVWPIRAYDGKHIPYADNHFDIVFSSNVLEHVSDLPYLQSEIRRVLKPQGVVIHIVPSASWRLWTLLAHYPFIIKSGCKILWNKICIRPLSKNHNEMENFALAQTRKLSKLELFSKAIFPPRHGMKGTALSEVYHFTRGSWSMAFESAGWKIEKVFSNKLFYTGYIILGSTMPIPLRRKVSAILGSACHIFKLKIASREQ